MKKKVLFFLPSSVGGAERVTITIAKMLDIEKYDVKFVVVGRSLGDIVKFIPENYETKLLHVFNIWDFAACKIYRLLRAEKPNCVFSSLIYLSGRVIIAAKLAKVKVVVRQNIGLSKYIALQSKFIIKHIYKFADIIVAQQEEMRDEILCYSGVPGNKVISIHNPIDIEYISLQASSPSPFSKETNQINYVCVARFSEEKGQDMIIRSFKTVRNIVKNAHLYLIGKYDLDRSYDKGIKSYIENNNLSDCIHLIGFDDNPYRWMKNCDCYVMPSRLEGMPNSLIEAMYLGCPVVATKCIPIIERIVFDGYNGYLVMPEDVDAMAQCMVRALELHGFQMTYVPEKSEYIKLFK